MKISTVKNLIPGPKDGVVYYLATTVSSISADSAGVPLTPTQEIVVTQWKKVGQEAAVQCADYCLVMSTITNGVEEEFGPSNWGREARLTAAAASGCDSLQAKLKDDSGHITACPILSIPVVRQGKDGVEGADGVSYEIIPSVQSVRADSSGNILTGVISVDAYKTVGVTRTSCRLGAVGVIDTATGESSVPYYMAEYRIDSGSWTACSSIAIQTTPINVRFVYGVPASAVSTIKSGIAFRLRYGKSSANSDVVAEIGALQVVKNGSQGERGKTGRFYCYAGYFVDDHEYTASDYEAPYVAYDWEDTVTVNGTQTAVIKTSYYMLVADTNKSGSTYIAPRTAAANGVWELMETNFKYLIAEAIFINFAKLGSAIFCGDWMISQHGKINGVDSTDYRKFNADDPTGETAGNFAPNYAVDLLTGKAYLNDAVIRGAIYATTGKFIGEIESVLGKIGGFDIGESNLTARKGSLILTPDGVKFGRTGESIAWLGSTDNIIGAFYAKMLGNFNFACGAQFGAEGGTKLNAAIDIIKGVVSGYVPVITEFSSNITIVCDNDVRNDTSYTKHVRSGGIFLPVGNSSLTVNLPKSPDNGTTYIFIRSNQANTVISCQGADKIAVNQKYQDANSSYTLSSYVWLSLIYSKGYWYGNT